MSSRGKIAVQTRASESEEHAIHVRQVRELTLLVLAIALVMSIGTVGFTLIEGWTLFESFFMTVITLTTIGYGEVHPLSHAGRWFTVGLIFMGVGIVGVAFTTLTDVILNRRLLGLFESRKMKETLAKLEKHTIICGYGRLGRIAAEELRSAGTSLVITDRDPERAQEASDAGFIVVHGDCTIDETLIDAGIHRAERLVSLLPKDADNLYVILTSRELNPKLFTLSRAEDELGEKRLKRAGADSIVSPYRVGGLKIADRLLRPYVTDFIDLAVTGSQGEYQIEEIKIPSDSPLMNKSLKETELRRKTNVIVAAILTSDGRFNFNPSGEAIIEPGSTLIGIGLKRDLAVLEKMLIG